MYKFYKKMTEKEFKDMFPEKSHLEGNELWNEMENYIFKNFQYVQEPLTDWMGNLVKEGDTVVIFRIRNFIRGDIYRHFINQDKQMIKIGNIPDNFVWENISEYKIKKVGNVLMYDIYCRDGYTFTVSTSFIKFGETSTEVICIKGLSDDKDEYIRIKGIILK